MLKSRKYSRTFWGSLPAALALWGLLTAPAAAPAQSRAEGGEDEFVNDFFLEALEGTGLESAPAIPPPPLSPANTPAALPPETAAPKAAEPPPAKRAGKPPLQTGPAPAEMPVAVLEPAPSPAPPPPALTAAEAAPLPAAEERPLPMPPEKAAPVAEAIGEELFLSPEQLATETGVEAAGLEALPSLQWETTDPAASPARFISDSPLPQFDASQSNWKQLEVGQTEASPPPPAIPGRPSSLPSVPEAPPESPAPPPLSGGATDREHLRSLFSDMLPPPALGARPPSLQLDPPPRAGGDATTPPAAAEVPEPASDAAPPAEPETAAAEEEGASAILRAGGQLTVAGHFGEAAILPRSKDALDLKTWLATRQTEGGQEAPEAKEQPAEAAAGKEARPPAKNRPAASANAPKKGGAAPKAPLAVTRSPLTLVNETGNDRMVEVYRSVLTQMGYSIAGVETRPPSAQPTGQTVIRYRPGLKGRAQSVAAHLPGRKVLVEDPGVMPTEISIFLR